MAEKPCFWPLGYIFSVKTFEFSIKEPQITISELKSFGRQDFI